jgi:two-component system chemotaxis sensor kinase CheA
MSIPNHSATFLLEADELLQQVEAVVLDLEARPEDAEQVNRLFRTFHTIKGSGSMFGFDAVAGFTHHVETALDQVREGRLQFTPALVTLILASKDHIQALLAAATSGTPADSREGDRIACELAVLQGAAPAAATEVEAAVAPVAAAGAIQNFRIFFRPEPGIFAMGMDPICLLNDLRALGDCTVVAKTDSVPALAELQSDTCQLAWDVTLATTQGEAAIRDVFIFVEDGAELRVELQAEVAPVVVEVAPVAPLPVSAPVLVEAAKTPASSPKAAGSQASVRVPSDRLDHLVNLVGELVINQSRLSQAQALIASSEMAAVVESMERLIAELRDSVLGIRMLPIGATFSRFQRLVRDLSSELGKEIDLVTEGADTELDKTVIDQLGDPLVHLIRNSMDHGIEQPDERVSKGKSRRGTLRLAAAHEGAHVVITIEDDGRGLDKSAIRAKAVEKGLIGADALLSDQDTFNLIFLPGFSTAKTISSVSGRGVGMDVVKRTIEELRGTISLSSPEGRGTVIKLTLPLTLAIIDGLLVEIEGDRFIVPMASVTENVELSREERRGNNGRHTVPVRGELIPYIRLRDLFEIRGKDFDLEKIVIVSYEGQRIGLVVDHVIGSHQTVIQPLGPFYRGVDLFSGSTIMGNGSVAMILNLAGVVRYAGQHPERIATAA